MKSNSGLAVMYHYVREPNQNAFKELKALKPDEFVRQINWLISHHEMIDYKIFQQLCDGAMATDHDKPFALLTFDDGFQDHFKTVFPILQKKHLRGIFFVAGDTLGDSPKVLNVHKIHFLMAHLGKEIFFELVSKKLEDVCRSYFVKEKRDPVLYRYDEQTEFRIKNLLNYELPFDEVDLLLADLFEHHLGSEREFASSLYLSKEMIRKMAENGMVFGYHSKTHKVLSRLSPDQQRAELVSGIETIRNLTGQETVPFCYPYGHKRTYNQNTLSLLEELQYSAAFNTVREFISGDSIKNRYEIPRFDTKDLPPFKEMSHA